MLYQNRIVVVGENVHDAYVFAQTDRFKDELESPVLLTSSSHPTTIRGSLAGMHVGTVYITPDAPDGANYSVVEEALKHCKGKNPAMQTVSVREEALQSLVPAGGHTAEDF